ncbi:MAG: alpha/beta hydrolase [Rhizobacter sp.]|nr:alpha/beta hydrolase [Rhizobacter sp.]
MIHSRRHHLIALASLGALGLPGCGTLGPAPAPTFTLPMADGTPLFVRRWLAVSGTPKGVVQVIHGAAEHSARYDRFAKHLNREGWLVYADDHRGHANTRVRTKALGDAGPDAWNKFVTDEKALTDHIKQQHPGLKVFLLGHSMGSFIAQDYVQRYGNAVAGVVLSGSNGVLANADQTVAAVRDLAKKDPLGPSPVFASVFESFNKPFTGKAGFEWLSRDAAEVKKYTDDPTCGFPFSNELVADFFTGLRDLWNPANEARIPKGMPIYVVSGDQDPVSGNTAGLKILLANYQRYGLTDVQHKFYPGARHEILNETNREEVERDIIAWLNAKRG